MWSVAPAFPQKGVNGPRDGNTPRIVMSITRAPKRRGPTLPQPRGSLTERLFAYLQQPSRTRFPAPDDIEDATLALYTLYELHYRGFDSVRDEVEWDPALLSIRASLERAFEDELREALASKDGVTDVCSELQRLAAAGGPSLSQWMWDHATLRELKEFVIHRSAYQLKEADPHTWAIPRIEGRAKAALVEIQHGEYGQGSHELVHAALFAETMRALDLDDTYGAYIDRLPATTLRTVNVISLFGLHRRWRGALVGHLALFEMCSVVPMARYSNTLRRLGCDTTEFYDAHVVADHRHASIALADMAGALATDEPSLSGDIVFGARALAFVESQFATHLLDAWSAGRSSLRCS
jgi:hypothetical protein